MPVPGANDGASGTAVLLGVADALKARGRAQLAAALSDVWYRSQTASSDADVLEIARRSATARKLLATGRRPTLRAS